MLGNVIVPFLILPRSRSKHRSGETILRRQGRVDNLVKVMFWRLIFRDNFIPTLTWLFEFFVHY